MAERIVEERIAHLEAEIMKIRERVYKPWQEEIKQVCLQALRDRIEMILRGEV